MTGHGCPRASLERAWLTARTAVAAIVWFRVATTVALAALALSTARGDDLQDLRVRIAWGGGTERLWHVVVSLNEGSFDDLLPLGIEADEPGSMWFEKSGSRDRAQLVVQQRSPRSYDGVDVNVHSPATATLRLQLTPDDQRDRPTVLEIPLADISGEFLNKEIDARGNRLLVMRAPGDLLRVRFSREHLIFAPGEPFSFALEPCPLSQPKGGNSRIKIQLVGGDGKERWSQQQDVPSDRRETIRVEVPLPKQEGVYDVVISAANPANWSQAVRQPLQWKRAVAERRIQLLVLPAERPPALRPARNITQVAEIDPANPRWFEKFNKLPQLQFARTNLPWIWKARLGNDSLQTRRHPLGDVAELNPNSDSPDVSWEAYWLPISQPGRPHLLEVEYPSDIPQTLGVSILEPNAGGSLMPIGVDFGLNHTAAVMEPGAAPHWLRHRVVFWPRTNTPLLLMSNGRSRMPAVYGKIRVLAMGDQLPRAVPQQWPKDRRLLAAYLDRPLLLESFSSGMSLDAWSGRILDDWGTFYDGSSRLIEYLNYAGYNGLMLGVLADGSTIYPSKLLQPTPRYDSGVYFASGQDPVRKDVVELLLRLFDREELQLIPMLEFAAPLPELEALRRAGGREAEGIEWIGAEGTALCASQPPQRGLAPHYNVLHPRVQQAMLAVLREFTRRYAKHPSLTGVALRLAANGYAQLPAPDWGMDDATISRFEKDCGVRVPGEGNRRFAQRAAFLAEEPQRRTWLEWRAAQLAQFHQRAADEVVAVRPNLRLYLAGGEMIAGPELQAALRPTLPRKATLAATLLQVGIDVRRYRDDPRITFLRPERDIAAESVIAQALDAEIGQMTDSDRYYQAAGVTGNLLYHQPREVRVDSFEQKNPFRFPASWFIAQPAPAASENRRRFVHGLSAFDAQTMVYGGWLLPLGQEEATRRVVAAYRALPATPFTSVAGGAAVEGSQPVTFRQTTFEGRTYCYVLNDAPFSATATVRVEANPRCRIEELTGDRKIAPLKSDGDGQCWEITLEPYDLVAVRFSEPGVRLSNPKAAWSEQVEAALASQIRQLGARVAALRNPPPLDAVANSGFEDSPRSESPIPHWMTSTGKDVTVALDKSQKRSGEQSVKLSSNGPVACLVSWPLAAPSTGRLAVAVWLRASDPSRQPPLRLAIDGKFQGKDYYRFAQVGLMPGGGTTVAPLLEEWGQYVFQVDDLPLEGLTSLRARFDLMGPGEVWIDDVQVFHLAFTKPEMVELSKLVALADVKLRNRQIGDCLHLMQGYWPRFLEENVPAPSSAAGWETMAARPPAAPEKPPERSGFLNRVKGILPETLWR